MEAGRNVAPEFVLGKGASTLVGRLAANFSAKKNFLALNPGDRTLQDIEKIYGLALAAEG
jgi:hypothetical protein